MRFPLKIVYGRLITIVHLGSGELKGMANLIISMFYLEDLNKQCILIPVSSKSVEKCGSCGVLNI